MHPVRDSESQAVCHAPDLITNHIFRKKHRKNKNKNIYIYCLFTIVLYIHFLNQKGKQIYRTLYSFTEYQNNIINMFKNLSCFNIHS